jgi:transposase
MIELSKEIDLSLEELIKKGESRVLKRALAIKMLKSGASIHYIKSILGVTDTFISNYKNKYYNEGASGLLLGYKGSVSYLSEAAKSSVLSYIKSQISIDLDSLIHYIPFLFQIANLEFSEDIDFQ